jgi:hypothetical protein
MELQYASENVFIPQYLPQGKIVSVRVVGVHCFVLPRPTSVNKGEDTREPCLQNKLQEHFISREVTMAGDNGTNDTDSKVIASR